MKNFINHIYPTKKDWYIVDATNKILGRLCTELAIRLQGKNKTEYLPYIDKGDYIIVVNARKISVTGKKMYEKIYYYHTGYVGGIKKKIFKDMLLSHPEKIIKHAVKGMLPKGTLGRMMLRKLKIYADNYHKHIAQRPIFLDIN